MLGVLGLADLVFEQLQLVVGEQRQLLTELRPAPIALEQVNALDNLDG